MEKIKHKKNLLKIKDIAIIAILVSILLLVNYILGYIPLIQLTILLIVVFSKKLGFFKSLIIIFVFNILDYLLSGSFNIIFILTSFIGYSLIPISLHTIFKKVDGNMNLALLGILFSFLFSWIHILPICFILNMDFISYLLTDIIFEIVMALSSFISILFLYYPLSKVFDVANIK